MDKIQKWFIDGKDINPKKYIKSKKISEEYPHTASVCEELCPYYGLCSDIPDPRDIENRDKSFLDFCTEDPSGDEVIPMKGSIEEYLESMGYDLYQTVLEYNPKVEIKKIINKVCKGWCENYDPSYCNCKATNYTCILKSLFEKES